MTITTVGYGDIVAVTTLEQIFAVMIMVLSIFFYSQILSSINFLKESTATVELLSQNKMREVQDLVDSHGLSKELKRKMIDSVIMASNYKSFTWLQ